MHTCSISVAGTQDTASNAILRTICQGGYAFKQGYGIPKDRILVYSSRLSGLYAIFRHVRRVLFPMLVDPQHANKQHQFTASYSLYAYLFQPIIQMRGLKWTRLK